MSDGRDRPSIPVTRPALPPLEEFIPSLRRIWDSRQLTNNGPFHQEFEAELARRLGVPFRSGGGLCGSKIPDAQAAYDKGTYADQRDKQLLRLQ